MSLSNIHLRIRLKESQALLVRVNEAFDVEEMERRFPGWSSEAFRILEDVEDYIASLTEGERRG